MPLNIRERLGLTADDEPVEKAKGDSMDVKYSKNTTQPLGGSGLPDYAKKNDGSFVGDQETVYGQRLDTISDEIQERVARASSYDSFSATLSASGDSRYTAETKDVADIPEVTLRDSLEPSELDEIVTEYFDPEGYDGLYHVEAEKTVSQEDGTASGSISITLQTIEQLQRRKIVPTDNPADYHGRKEIWKTIDEPESLPRRTSSARNLVYSEPELELTIEYSIEL